MSKDKELPDYHRPKTRGELKEKLADGVPCEVAKYTAEMTSNLLKGWLNFSGFTVRPSERPGMVVFEPVT